jgi:RNA polymerase sigma-70 factor (ECF subfamily)
VEDVVQESFLKVWKNIKKFDNQKARFKTWLMLIVRNTAIDHTRKRKNISFSQLDTEEKEFSESITDDMPLPDEIMAKKGDVAALELALSHISEPHREVLLLYNGNDFTFEEIASILDISVNTVKSRYRRAVHALREVMTHPNGEGARI